MERCPQPVIAAIHGACVGGAVDLACACDVRLCSEDARFCIAEVKVGLAADVGTLQRMPKVRARAGIVCLRYHAYVQIIWVFLHGTAVRAHERWEIFCLRCHAFVPVFCFFWHAIVPGCCLVASRNSVRVVVRRLMYYLVEKKLYIYAQVACEMPVTPIFVEGERSISFLSLLSPGSAPRNFLGRVLRGLASDATIAFCFLLWC